jgi:hypothetical protein
MDKKHHIIAPIGIFRGKNIQLLFGKISQKSFFHIADILAALHGPERTGKRNKTKNCEKKTLFKEIHKMQMG